MSNEFKLKNGTLLLVTEAPGGIYNSSQLKKIAALSEEDGAIVKVTEDQRLALFVDEGKVNDVQNHLTEVGLGIRHYQDGLHQPVTCIGELCVDHKQDALGDSMVMTAELASTDLDGALKIGVNGCASCCVPCHTLDIAIMGDDNGYRVNIGGKNSQLPEMASFIAEGIPSSELSEKISNIVNLYKDQAKEGESLQELIDRVGTSSFIEALMPYSQDAASEDPFDNGLSMSDVADGDDQGDLELDDLPSEDSVDMSDETLLEDDGLNDELGREESLDEALTSSSVDDSDIGVDDEDLLEADSIENISPNESIIADQDSVDINPQQLSQEIDSEETNEIPIHGLDEEDVGLDVSDLEGEVDDGLLLEEPIQMGMDSAEDLGFSEDLDSDLMGLKSDQDMLSASDGAVDSSDEISLEAEEDSEGFEVSDSLSELEVSEGELEHDHLMKNESQDIEEFTANEQELNEEDVEELSDNHHHQESDDIDFVEEIEASDETTADEREMSSDIDAVPEVISEEDELESNDLNEAEESAFEEQIDSELDETQELMEHDSIDEEMDGNRDEAIRLVSETNEELDEQKEISNVTSFGRKEVISDKVKASQWNIQGLDFDGVHVTLSFVNGGRAAIDIADLRDQGMRVIHLGGKKIHVTHDDQSIKVESAGISFVLPVAA